MGPRTIPALAVAAALTLALAATVEPAKAESPSEPSDFDGDGYADLAIGAPYELPDGAVNILYGSPSGLTELADESFTRDTPGIKGTIDDGDWFGYALAAADFDRDGYSDLAIGGVGADIDSAAVNILYGSEQGLTVDGDQLWTAAGLGFNSSFGQALEAGDFDDDGFADLAIGVPHQEVGPYADGGAVVIMRGSPIGLTAAGMRSWSQANAGIQGVPMYDQFGGTLAVGDLDGDGIQDLAVGVPGDDDDAANAGAVNILFGSSSGLTAAGSQRWSQDTPGIMGMSESGGQGDSDDDDPGERFGSALAIGDLDDDGWDDLAIGVPGEGWLIGSGPSKVRGGGVVHVLYGTRYGLTAARGQLWSQDVAGIAGTGETFDLFGASLAAGDVDGDGLDDLAIGAPGESLASKPGEAHGVIHALYGSRAGLSVPRSQVWSQESAGVPGIAEDNDHFGSQVALADYGRSGQEDLVVGLPSEGIGLVLEAGSVAVLYGRSTGLSATGVQSWHQNTTGILGAAREREWFGSALTP